MSFTVKCNLDQWVQFHKKKKNWPFSFHSEPHFSLMSVMWQSWPDNMHARVHQRGVANTLLLLARMWKHDLLVENVLIWKRKFNFHSQRCRRNAVTMNSWTSLVNLCMQNHSARQRWGVSHRCKMREKHKRQRSAAYGSLKSWTVASDKVWARQEDGWLHVNHRVVMCHKLQQAPV